MAFYSEDIERFMQAEATRNFVGQIHSSLPEEFTTRSSMTVHSGSECTSAFESMDVFMFSQHQNEVSPLNSHARKNCVSPYKESSDIKENFAITTVEEEKRQEFTDKSSRNVSSKAKRNNRKRGIESPGNSSSEICKDFVVVRARRGQATDRHSIAERARREKIRKRMNYLQELVPGCCKVGAGKTVILDEIINYVKSLQNQVEFLSMKLSAASASVDIGGYGQGVEVGLGGLGEVPIVVPVEMGGNSEGMTADQLMDCQNNIQTAYAYQTQMTPIQWSSD